MADRSTLTYRVQSVDFTDLTSRPIAVAAATTVRTTTRDIQSRDLTALAQTEGPLLTAFRAAARRKVELDAAAAAAAREAQLAFVLTLLTLFLVPALRRRNTEARRRADEARVAAGHHMARIRHEGNPTDLVMLWDRVPSGLDECYMFSNASAAERFGEALTELVNRLRALELRVTSTAG